MVKTHVEESLGANPADAALNPADQVAMGVPAGRTRFLHSPRGRAFRALNHRPFRLLFTAFLINQTGFWISNLAMQGLMVRLSGNDPLWMGLLFFALFLPTFAFAPLAGMAADRFDRRHMMLASYGNVALLSAVLAALVAADWIGAPGLLWISLGMGMSFAFSGPAAVALAVNAVPASDMPSAVSLQSATNNLTRVLGPVAAAPILASGHYQWAFLAFVVTAIAAASMVASMRVAPQRPEPEEGGILARLAAGFSHARERRPALAALVAVGTVTLFGASHTVLLPVYAESVLGSFDTFAWIVVASGGGAMLGALSIGYREAHPSMRSAALGLLVYAVCLGVFARTSSLGVALACQFAIGWSYFAAMTGLQTLVQSVVDDSRRGRVMSLFQVAWGGLMPWGSLLMGATADAIGVTTTLSISAAICGVYALGILARSVRG